MSEIKDVRDRLAALLRCCDISILWDGDEPVLDIDGLFAEEGTALADRLERGDAAVAAVERVRLLCDEYAVDQLHVIAAEIRSALDPDTNGGDRG